VEPKYILRIIQSNPDTAPLFVNSWHYVEGGKIPKYCVLRNSVRKLSRALSEGGAISRVDCNLLCVQAFHKGDYMSNALWNVSSCSLVNGSRSFWSVGTNLSHYLMSHSTRLFASRFQYELKGKIHPRTRHEGPGWKYKYSSMLDGGGWPTPHPGRFAPLNDRVPIE